MESSEGSPIKKFFDGADVFITGGSGFVGKVLIEKLLRSCPGIRTIFLLLRSKKGMSDAERIANFSSNRLYETLQRTNPNWMDKLHVIRGDVMDLNLGISEFDKEKLKTCSVIFHSAASVRFDDPVKKAILLNTRGTREVCELARTMPNLKALIHVSTAYINPRNLHVDEVIYPTDASWREYIKFAETFDESLLNGLSQKLTRFAPNTYTYSKHLAEHVCIDYRQEFDLPIVLIRPSIITATEVEPVGTFIDNVNGPVSLALLTALGITHLLQLKPTRELNTIPVDICIKGIIIAAYKVATEPKLEEIPIYNAASIKCVTYSSLLETTDFIMRYPSMQAVSTPFVVFTECPFYAMIVRIFLNLIPAVIIDGLLCLTGNKPRLLKTHRLIFNAEASLKYFQRHSFTINNFKFNDLNLTVPKHEKKDFFVNASCFADGELYRQVYKNMLGDFLKEKPSDLPKARRRYFFIRLTSRMIALSFCYFVFCLLNRIALMLMK